MKRIRKEHFKYFISLGFKKRFYISETIKYKLHSNNILINGFAKSTNFGDALNVPLVEFLSEKKAIAINNILLKKEWTNNSEHYTVVGSILHLAKAGSNVWGGWFMSGNVLVDKKPKKVYAVRGPLSREVYLRNGVESPEVFGDPALLLPYIYNPTSIENNKIGIIPHYVDKNNKWLQKQRKEKDVLVIDVETGYDWKKFVDQLVRCKLIISSSLHGIIVANAYNIPSVWVSFSDKITGGTFKFRDYYLSVGKSISTPIIVQDNTTIEDLVEKLDYEPNNIDLNLLLEACPFVTEKVKELLQSKINISKRNSLTESFENLDSLTK